MSTVAHFFIIIVAQKFVITWLTFSLTFTASTNYKLQATNYKVKGTLHDGKNLRATIPHELLSQRFPISCRLVSAFWLSKGSQWTRLRPASLA